MPIRYFFEDAKPIAIPRKKISDWIKSEILRNEKTPGEINIVFCSDEHLLGINRQYLEHDYYTDIITFDYSEDRKVSSDIFISLDRVKENATELGVEFRKEILRVIIHGILHLLGFKDKSEKEVKEMRKAEEEAMGRFLTIAGDVPRETKTK